MAKMRVGSKEGNCICTSNDHPKIGFMKERENAQKLKF